MAVVVASGSMLTRVFFSCPMHALKQQLLVKRNHYPILFNRVFSTPPVHALTAEGTMDDPHAAKIGRLQEIMKTTNSWEQCWSEGVTPWDTGGVTPILADLIDKQQLPEGKALVPGCGAGYDVLALASPQRHVVGLDFSETALERARQMASTNPSAKWVEFVCADFFTYSPSTPFDLIFDYTFFCALEPSLRSKWGAKIAELLAPHGELITLMFPVSNEEGGPPYAVSREEYEKVLQPWGLNITFYEANHLSHARRKGREYLGRWRKFTTKM